MDDLGSPSDWHLKGEGNANLVFAYAGSDPRLVGRVLRVRKPRAPPAPEQAALEDAVWAPVLGPMAAVQPGAAAAGNSADDANALAAAAAQREQLYVQRLLAPLLGLHHIPPPQPVRASPAFLQQLLCSSSNDEAPAAAAGTAALLPDVTLLPGAQQQAPHQRNQQQQAQPQPAQQRQTSGQPVGPVVCVELKPKCGFVTSCGTVHPSNRELKHSRSRYQLHQLLKLSQGKIDARSAYDPCDLFSGDPTRLRSALAALLEQPQNNLVLFVDGQRQQLAGQQRRKAQRAQQQQQQRQQQQGDAQQQAQLQQQQGDQHSARSLQQMLGSLLPLQEEQRQGALTELLAAVLEREGVLPRLLQAQQQCRYDVEGVYRLYCQLAGLRSEQEQAGVTENGSGAGSKGSGSSGNGSSSGDGNTSSSGSEDADSSAAHAAAVVELLALPEADAHAVLRSYVLSATAKDCALMVALQRLDGPPTAAAAAACGAALEAGGRAAVGAAAGSEAACISQAAVQQSAEEQQRCWGMPPACICVPNLGSGREAYTGGSGSCCSHWFRYRLCFVDLDLKPLAKIPAHAALDRSIVAAARRHLSAASATGGATGVS